MTRRLATTVLAVTAALACGTGTWEMPAFPDGGLLAAAVPLAGTGPGDADPAVALEAVYVADGKGQPFGDRVAVRVRDGRISIFGGPGKAYAVTTPGCLADPDRVVIEGYWRNAAGGRTGLVRLFVEPPEAAAALCAGDVPSLAPRLAGTFGSGPDLPVQPFTLAFEAPLRQTDPPFRVVAHRGGCRTLDQCGASENSVEVIRLAGPLGADAIEIDVQLTADGVPILYHDDTFTDRLVEGPYCRGPVASFPLAHIRALCTLEYGEDIPTLEEALRAVVEDTSLANVWLDLKTPSVIAPAVEATTRWREKAAQAGRTIRFIHGLYSDAMVDAWNAADLPDDAMCLVELDPKDVRGAGCEVWAPRWTRGPMGDRVRRVQESGRSVAFWTLDEPEFIDTVLVDARPNAICTNRPGLVFQRFQVVGEAPWGPKP